MVRCLIPSLVAWIALCLPATAAPDTACDVYIVAGQSNMDGRGTANELTGTNAAWIASKTNILIYYANPMKRDGLHPDRLTGWKPLGTGFSVPPGFKADLPSPKFGPELSFAATLADRHPARPLALIKVTQGGTSLHGDWNPRSGYMYRCLTNAVPDAMRTLHDQGRNGTIKGMIWHQGESDVSLGGEAYYTNLTAFITSVRRDLSLPGLPFVIGEIATNKLESFRLAQRTVATDIPGAAFASADALKTVEGTHFTTDSVLEFGRRFAQAMESIPATASKSP